MRKKDLIKKNSNEHISTIRYMVKKIWVQVACFLFPYLVAFSHSLLNGYCIPRSYQYAITSKLALAGAIIVTVISILVEISISMDSIRNKTIESQERKLDSLINKASITFEAGINEFDDKHLLAFHRILTQLEQEIKKPENALQEFNIYAIDNSDPRTWWSDTMIGYLALLSKIKQVSIHRFFICQKNELLSPILAKTVGLHSLMGFKTYVIVYDKYIEILKTIRNIKPNNADINNKYDIEKEVFIWTKKNKEKQITTFNAGSTFTIDFNLDELHHSKTWSNVKCYQSFWNVDSDYNFREHVKNKRIFLKNYYGYTVDSKAIQIWFEFIAKEKDNKKSNPEKDREWNELPQKYISFIEALLKKIICCKEANELPDMNSDYVGVEIRTERICPTASCPHHMETNCINAVKSKFDFTTMSSVKAILQEYYNKLK